MTACAGGADFTGFGDVLDLPLLEDIPTLTTPEPYAAERCLGYIQMANESRGRCDSGTLVKPPSYPSLFMDVKEDPYASHFLDPGTEEPESFDMPEQHSADLSNESSRSTPPGGFRVEQGSSSLDGLDASSGNTSLICGQATGMCAQEQGIEGLESEVVRTGTQTSQGSRSSTDFMSLLSMPGVLESMVTLERTGDMQSIEDSENWKEFETPQELNIDFMVEAKDSIAVGRLEFPPQWQTSYSACRGGRVTETARGSSRGRERSVVDARGTNPEVSPEDAKRIRRMLSNRESARRSRHRKQAHLLDLENQVSRLSTEKGQLEEHLHQMAERLRAGDDENSSLQRQVEHLRTHVLKLVAAINRGSSKRMDSKKSCLDYALLDLGQDTAGGLRTRKRRLRSTRGSLERSLKQSSF